MAGKYAPLSRYLVKQKVDGVTLAFSDIEKIIDAKLPRSAFIRNEWWDNGKVEGRHSYGWLGAGFISTNLNLKIQEVTFTKK